MTKTYHNLQDALDNPLDVLILEMSMNTRISMGLHELESLPRVIGLFQNLEKLNLDGNQLTSLPKEIGQLQKLRVLNLAGNQFTSLPKEIGQLQN
ncbi:leucine-rich repeat domain-containing protein, partial [Leptospira interrogans]